MTPQRSNTDHAACCPHAAAEGTRGPDVPKAVRSKGTFCCPHPSLVDMQQRKASSAVCSAWSTSPGTFSSSSGPWKWLQ